jgi:hypothetical protein
LEESSMDDAKRAALTAASDRCERIAAATINPTALLDEFRKAIAVLRMTHIRWCHCQQRRGRCCG